MWSSSYAMHVAAANPEFLTKEEVDADSLAKIKEVLVKELEGRPENLKEQILQGKIDSYFSDKILLAG
jgi:elongation factor Ts